MEELQTLDEKNMSKKSFSFVTSHRSCRRSLFVQSCEDGKRYTLAKIRISWLGHVAAIGQVVKLIHVYQLHNEINSAGLHNVSCTGHSGFP